MSENINSKICEIKVMGTGEVILSVHDFYYGNFTENTISLNDEDGRSLMGILQNYLDLKVDSDTGRYDVKMKGILSGDEQKKIDAFFMYVWRNGEIEDVDKLRKVLNDVQTHTTDAEGIVKAINTKENLFKLKPFFETIQIMIGDRLKSIDEIN